MDSLFKIDKSYILIDYVYPLYFIIAFLELYMGMYGISVYIKYVSFILLLLFGIRVYKICPDYKGIKSVFTLFLIYNLSSIIWYVFNGVTFRCYLNEVFNSIPAMFFFYIGMSDRRKDERFFLLFMYACSICMLIGFYLYLSMPEWFIANKTEIINNQWFAQYDYKESDITSSMRFSSYLSDTYEADIYAIFSFGIAMSFLYNHKNYYGRTFAYIFILINLVAAILTQQRVAMAAVSFYFIFFIIWGYKNRNKKDASNLFFTIILLVALVMPVLFEYFDDRLIIVQELLKGRIENMSMSKALGERDYQIKLLTDYWSNPIMGHGIGSGGSVARSFGYPAVTDCAYIEMLYEIGIIGFIFYMFILIKTAFRGIAYLRCYMAELCIIGFVAVASIGSNTLTMGFFAIAPFWYCLGRIWNPHILRYYLSNKV